MHKNEDDCPLHSERSNHAQDIVGETIWGDVILPDHEGGF